MSQKRSPRKEQLRTKLRKFDYSKEPSIPLYTGNDGKHAYSSDSEGDKDNDTQVQTDSSDLEIVDVISSDYNRGRGLKRMNGSSEALKVESDGYQSDGESSDLSLIADDIVNDVMDEESSVARQRHSSSSPTANRERLVSWTARRGRDRETHGRYLCCEHI